MTHRIADVLISRDGMSRGEAERLVEGMRIDFMELVDSGDFAGADNYLSDILGLEPDYLDDLMLGVI